MNQNTGVWTPKPKKEDWRFGAETGIIFQNINPTSNWESYLPPGESQFISGSGYGFETYACVSYSRVHCIATELNFMLAHGLIPTDKIKKCKDWGYIDATGKFNFSARFVAKGSGTVYQGLNKGNGLTQVGDFIRKVGLIPYSMYPQEGVKTVEEYYQELTPNLLSFAKNILTIFDFPYEWVVERKCDNPNIDMIKQALQQSPLQTARPSCTKDEHGIFQPCGTCVTTHATEIYNVADYIEDFDQYIEFKRKLALDHPIPWILKGTIVIKEDAPPSLEPPFNHAFYKNMQFGQRLEEVRWLQKGLIRLGYKTYPTGFYGDITRMAVLKFQQDNKVDNPITLWMLQGKYVGSKTRSALNKLLNA